ncbi:MAG TPA: 5'-3' exonuclease H3TH domain-containing protein, partial [Acidobacteriota bacterium]|nr:5'-3' exonuclease H3TH domain-containing protein [Acidobacteriota bacterium]
MAAQQRERLFLIDGTALAYRAYFAFIRNPLRTASGENTSAVFGVANSLLKIRREENPDYWVFTFDRPEPTFRHKIAEDYKATRPETPDELIDQLPRVKEAADALGCPLIEMPGYEADDLIATLARRAVKEGLDVVIVSGDKDLMQLVTDRITIYNPRKAGAEVERLDPAGVKEKFGVPPEQVRDVLALMGDTSDNVPGIPGIGPKTAIQLIGEYGDLEATLAAADSVKRESLREKLKTHADKARLSFKLVTLDENCPIDWEPDRWRVVDADDRTAVRLFTDLRFKSLLKWLSPAAGGTAPADETPADEPAAVVDRAGAYHRVTSLTELRTLAQ